MNFLEQIKTKIGRWTLGLNKKKSSPAKSIPVFEKINDIGIIYQVGLNQQELQINEFAKSLREQGKKVWLMGYVDSKLMPSGIQQDSQSSYFNKSSLKWNNLPDISKVENFINHRFDLLLNLYLDNQLPLQALSSYSRNNYAMGAALPDCLAYNDGVIDIGSNKEIRFLASQMVQYLQIINHK